MNYLQWERSPLRRGAVVAGVVLFHVVVIYEVAHWRGWMPVVGEGLLRVSIFADVPPTPKAPGPRPAAPGKAKSTP